MANVEFGTGKTVVILSIVAACFAVLWPKIFYPMLTAISHKKAEPDGLNGCCDVIFETDINAIKIMTEMCGSIMDRQGEFNPKLSLAFQQGKLTKEIVNTCRSEVMNVCGIDIAEFLSKREKLGHSYKHMLDEIRSFNISLCLRENFGVSPGLLGAPRRMRIWDSTGPGHLRQERPLHFRPEIIHPALREKGRAIPQSHIVPKVTIEKEQPSGPIPMPGMRPPMGGAGHVVPPPKVGGTMSVVMPLYTIGIVIFFMYTVMKVFTKKTNENEGLKDFHSDPEFRRVVFSEDCSNGSASQIGDSGSRYKEKQFSTPQIWKSPTDDSTRLVMSAITGLLTEVNQQLNREGDTQTQYSTEHKNKNNLEELQTEDTKVSKKKLDLEVNDSEDLRIRKEMNKNSHSGVQRGELDEKVADETKPKVKVVGLELMAECEGGKKWSRPATPNLGVGTHSRPSTPLPFENPEPQNIFLEGALPQQSQLLVSDSKTRALTPQDTSESDPPVILSSKMTLSLISLDAPLPEDARADLHSSQKHLEKKSEDENLNTTDSTLLDVDSDVIDETGQTENETSQVHEDHEDIESESANKHENEIIEEQSNFTTASTNERAEAGLLLDMENTGVDSSNFDDADLIDDRDSLRSRNAEQWNGNFKVTENNSDHEYLQEG